MDKLKKEIQEQVNEFEQKIVTDELLQKAIQACLNDKQKEILCLYLKGISSKEIGLFLNEKTINITNHIEKLKYKIINYCLEKHGIEKLLYDFTFNEINIPEELILEKLNQTSAENEMILWMYGLKDGKDKTHQEIGDIFNITRERARMLIAKRMRNLRKELLNEIHT